MGHFAIFKQKEFLNAVYIDIMDLRIVRHSKKQELSEQQLADGCLAGNVEARKQLYQRYAGRMLAICLRYVGSRQTAEDLLHDGYIKIYDQIGKFSYQGEGSLQAWMSRVMANMALQYLRHNDVLSQTVDIDDTYNLDGSIDRPDEEPETDCIPQQVLMRFIEELPVGYRTVFNMYVFEKMSHKEIAAQLGINDHSSASQLTRARAILVSRIKEWQKKNA